MQINHILAALDPQVSRGLVSAARQIQFNRGEVVIQPRQTLSGVLFPMSGMLSVSIVIEDKHVATAVAAHSDVLGSDAKFCDDQNFATVFGEIPGTGYLVPAKNVTDIANRDVRLGMLLDRERAFMLAQAQQTAACNARHSARQRVASWILRIMAALNSNRFAMTQFDLARMIGVERATVSGIAIWLADSQAIKYRRGFIEVISYELLANCACECHRRIHEERKRLFDGRC